MPPAQLKFKDYHVEKNEKRKKEKKFQDASFVTTLLNKRIKTLEHNEHASGMETESHNIPNL